MECDGTVKLKSLLLRQADPTTTNAAIKPTMVSRRAVDATVATAVGCGRPLRPRWGSSVGTNSQGVGSPVRFSAVDDSPEIYENMAKALAILTAWNESGDGDLSLVEQTTVGYLEAQPDAGAKVAEAINLVSGLVSLGGRMLLQLAQSLGRSEDELLRIMGERIAYRS